MFMGFVELGESLLVGALVRNSSGTPQNLDALPTYRVYGPDGLVPNQTGTGAKKDTGSVTGASNDSPVVITSSAHGLSTGARVTVSGVGGNTAANGTFNVTVLTADTFSLDGSTGNGSYTSGGAWFVTGLYQAELTCSEANGYASGETYSVLFSGAISSTALAELVTFTVG